MTDDVLGRGGRNPNALEAIVRKLQRDLAQLQSDSGNAELRDKLRQIVDRLDEDRRSRGQYTANEQGRDAPGAQPRTIEDIPGPRSLKIYEVLIPFEEGATGVQSNSIPVSTDGPFICTHIAATYQIVDTEQTVLNGMFVPVTRYFMLVNGGSALTTAQITAGVIGSVPELSFQVQSQGSGRFLTNRAIAGPSWGDGRYPFFLGRETWFESKDNIMVYASPEIAMPLAGTVRFSLIGYQITRNISIAEQLGY